MKIPHRYLARLAPISGAALIMTGLLGMGAAQATPMSAIIVPNANANTEGNSNNGYPFDTSAFPNGASSTRYQEVFSSSQFASLSGPTSITGLAFRPDAKTGAAFTSTLPDVQINLSTTGANTSTLSGTFADNVGADDTAVYARGPLSLSSSATGPLGGPEAFDIFVDFTQPFTYDPSQGNLLLDVRNFGGGATTPFDDQQYFGSAPVTSVFTLTSGVNSPTADQVYNGFIKDGLIAQFKTASATTTPVPEPPILILFGLSLLGLAVVAVRKRRRATPGFRGGSIS
jgi:hypothetical protein